MAAPTTSKARTARPRPAAVKAPQDRKPKATDGFTFDHEGRTHVLPAPGDAAAKIDGKTVRDALLGGEGEQVILALKTLEASEPDPDALAALYAKPSGQMLEIVAAWFQNADRSGATLPQS